MTKNYTSLLIAFIVTVITTSFSYACDYDLKGELTFEQFQKVLDNATYVDVEAGIKICLAPGTKIINPPGSKFAKITINKDDISLLGDKTGPAIIENQRTDASLWEHSALLVQDTKINEIANLNIVSSGVYGPALFLNDARIKSFHDISLTTISKSTPVIRIETRNPPTSKIISGIDFMSNIKIVSKGAYSTGLTVVRSATFEDINNLSITLYSDEPTHPTTLFGTSIKSIRNLNVNFYSGNAISLFDNSNIGIMDSVKIQARKSGSAIFASESTLGYVGNLNFTSKEPSSAIIGLYNSQVGTIRRTYLTSPQALNPIYASSSLVGLLQCNFLNGLPSKVSQNQSVIEEISNCNCLPATSR